MENSNKLVVQQKEIVSPARDRIIGQWEEEKGCQKNLKS